MLWCLPKHYFWPTLCWQQTLDVTEVPKEHKINKLASRFITLTRITYKSEHVNTWNGGKYCYILLPKTPILEIQMDMANVS